MLLELITKRIVAEDEESEEYISFLEDLYTDLLVAAQWLFSSILFIP